MIEDNTDDDNYNNNSDIDDKYDYSKQEAKEKQQ